MQTCPSMTLVGKWKDPRSQASMQMLDLFKIIVDNKLMLNQTSSTYAGIYQKTNTTAINMIIINIESA